MNNKKPLELFQDIPNDVTDNKKTLELKQKYNLNNYDCDNIIQDKTKLSDIESKLNIKYVVILYLSNLSYETLNSYNVICQDMEIIQ